MALLNMRELYEVSRGIRIQVNFGSTNADVARP